MRKECSNKIADMILEQNKNVSSLKLIEKKHRHKNSDTQKDSSDVDAEIAKKAATFKRKEKTVKADISGRNDTLINAVSYHLKGCLDIELISVFAYKIGQSDLCQQMIQRGEQRVNKIMKQLLHAWKNETDAMEENTIRFLNESPESPEFSECVSFLKEHLKKNKMKRAASDGNLLMRGYRGTVERHVTKPALKQNVDSRSLNETSTEVYMRDIDFLVKEAKKKIKSDSVLLLLVQELGLTHVNVDKMAKNKTFTDSFSNDNMGRIIKTILHEWKFLMGGNVATAETLIATIHNCSTPESYDIFSDSISYLHRMREEQMQQPMSRSASSMNLS